MRSRIIELIALVISVLSFALYVWNSYRQDRTGTTDYIVAVLLGLMVVSIIGVGWTKHRDEASRHEKSPVRPTILILPQAISVRLWHPFKASVSLTVVSNSDTELRYLRVYVSGKDANGFVFESGEPTRVARDSAESVTLTNSITQTEWDNAIGVQQVAVSGYGKFGKENRRVDFSFATIALRP